MSAFPPKADIERGAALRLLMTQSGHPIAHRFQWSRTVKGFSPFDVPPPSATYHLDDRPINGKQSDCSTENNEEENLIEVESGQNVVNHVLCVAS